MNKKDILNYGLTGTAIVLSIIAIRKTSEKPMVKQVITFPKGYKELKDKVDDIDQAVEDLIEYNMTHVKETLETMNKSFNERITVISNDLIKLNKQIKSQQKKRNEADEETA